VVAGDELADLPVAEGIAIVEPLVQAAAQEIQVQDGALGVGVSDRTS
jgi:hypothetical protein